MPRRENGQQYVGHPTGFVHPDPDGIAPKNASRLLERAGCKAPSLLYPMAGTVYAIGSAEGCNAPRIRPARNGGSGCYE